MNRNYIKISVAPLEIERLLSCMGQADDGSHLKKKLLAARKKYERVRARAKEKGRALEPRPNL